MTNFKTLENFKRLNEVQKEAVLHDKGPLLVLAGAGTGKTGVLTTRLSRLLIENIALPGEILAVTFTNKAANEMRSRVSDQIGDKASGLKWLGTFHSIGAQILRTYPEKIGLKNDFIILDTDDQIRLLKQLIRDENIDDEKWSPKGLLNLIDKWKNKGILPENISRDDGDYFANGKGAILYKKYQDQLKFFNAADFGDLILECIRLFNENQDILQQYQNRFKFMLVDEYQDTNSSQYSLLKLLSNKWMNICCVGDDDQSIYSWRGAEVSNILRFEKDFPNAKIIRLEQNYRSTGNILAAASRLIESNESRFGKTLWTSSSEGEKVSITSTWDGEEEARIITDEIESYSLNNKNLDEIAILVRASFQMREFEDRFISVGLPYKVIGGPRFYERKEIRDANAYFRIAIQPNDSLALERVLNTPKRGIGETTIKKIKDYSKNNNISKNGTPDSWACCWFFSCLINGGLTALPNLNLVNNIGFGDGSTHTKGRVINTAIKRGLDVTQHPTYLLRDVAADHYTFDNHFGGKWRRFPLVFLGSPFRLARKIIHSIITLHT